MVQTERGMKAMLSCLLRRAPAPAEKTCGQADMKELRDVVTQQSQKVQAPHCSIWFDLA